MKIKDVSVGEGEMEIDGDDNNVNSTPLAIWSELLKPD
jgi:hypothetical protein